MRGPDPLANRATQKWVACALAALVVISVAARVIAFLELPNIDGDAYSYLDKARAIRAAILAGTFRPTDLFFFWLPLYPLAVALISLPLPGGGHIMFVARLLSAASGLVACWFTYRLVAAMTGRRWLGVVGAGLVALDPWQALYASNSMTELPFEALVLAALDRVLARRWSVASVLLVAAGFIRIEAWPLGVLLAFVACVVERRLKLAPVLLAFIAPLTWLAISYAAKGDPRAYFTIRNAYVAEYLAHEPERLHLSVKWAQWDLANLRQGACAPFIAGAVVAGIFLAWRLARRRSVPGMAGAGAVVMVYAFFLSFLLAAYVTRSQPVLWVRYGLIFQPLGVCLTLWWVAQATRGAVRWCAAGIFLAGTIAHAAVEVKVTNDTRGNLRLQREAAALLASLHPRRVFCDSIVVRVEAGLAPDHACESSSMRTDAVGFLEDLHRAEVDYLVYIDSEASTPVRVLPELANLQPMYGFVPLRKIDSPDWRPPVLLYRVGPASP